MTLTVSDQLTASIVMPNSSLPFAEQLPPLPGYELYPRPSLIPGVPDVVFKIFIPAIVYWGFSLFFHIIDTFDIFPQYRIHTLEEYTTRNRATMKQVIISIFSQQALQISLGMIRVIFGSLELEYYGKEDYDIAVWGQKIRLAQRWIPKVLGVVGLDAVRLATRVGDSLPTLAAILRGGQYPFLTQTVIQDGSKVIVPAFATWELAFAKFLFSFGVPLFQFAVAIFILDTWQYSFHRWMHVNKFMYTRYHSCHHRLYVPYAFGALYNHPVEGFLLDTCGAILATGIPRLNHMQGAFFFIMTTIKTIDDHCGYSFPWDPLQHITPNRSVYHDIHHQNWGIKTNFSQPFLIVWDRWLGTMWEGGDTTKYYVKAAAIAKANVEAENKKKALEAKNAAK